MEFWGVEVPSGKPLTCDPGEDSYVHVSQAALGESKTGKGSDRVVLKVKVGNKEVVIGTLSQGKCDQTTLDLIFEKEFALSHNSSGSVYFCGYKTDAVREENWSEDEDDESAESDDDDEEDIRSPAKLAAKENGKPGLKAAKSEVLATKPGLKAAKSEVLATKPGAKLPAQKVDLPMVEVRPPKPALKEEKGKVGDDDDEDDDDDGEDDDEDDVLLESGSEDDDLDSDEEDDSDEDDESEQEQPESAGKKRPLPGAQNVGSGKKSKVTTPMGGAKPGKTDPKTPSTPAPTPKQQQQGGKKDLSAKKTPGKESSSQAHTPASGKKLGQYLCEPCNKNFTSESGLSQHKSAKHK